MQNVPSTTDPQVPAQLHCMTCGAVTPHPQPHTCRLSKRDLKRREVWQAKRAAARKYEMQPRPCEMCLVEYAPGTSHFCVPQPNAADQALADARLADLRRALRAAGYDITPIAPTPPA